jgi:signal-transduction protein with cAMP-binding, CBS, and nucleotidyltransferase domain
MRISDRKNGSAPAGEEQEKMKVADILKKKGSQVFTIKPAETIAALSRQLQTQRVGAIVVSHNGKVIDGIISERDIAYSLCERRGELHLLPVSALMSRQVVSCSPSDTLNAAALVMSRRKIRHLPVTDRGELMGIISMRDIMEFRLGELERRSAALQALVLAHE